MQVEPRIEMPAGMGAASGLSQAALRHGVLPMPDLRWTPEVERETAHLYEKVKRVIPPVEWPFHAPYVKAINELKRERNAVILAHNYQTPEIYNCVADVVGDSLQLARLAGSSDADIIIGGCEGGSRYLLHVVQCGESGREPWRRSRHFPARSLSGTKCRRADEGEDHRLDGRLRSA